MAPEKVFISSTYDDLKEHRAAVFEILQRIQISAQVMEFFGARPQKPIDVCLSEIEESDLVLVILAHRYGWIPEKHPSTPRLGDGLRSITHLEIDYAIELCKPLLVFVIDEKAPWSGPREQDQLLTNSIDQASRIAQAVQRLVELKTNLMNAAHFERFNSVDDLAKKAAAALHNYLSYTRTRPMDIGASSRLRQELRCVHRLHFTEPFLGRDNELAFLDQWLLTRPSTDTVLQVLAAGGSGKTALLGKWIETNKKRLALHGGSALVWSFYLQPDPESFLRTCTDVFLGHPERTAVWRPEALAERLSDGGLHTLILDGVDALVKSESSDRALGEIEHVELREFLYYLASGLGKSKTIFTSRMPLAVFRECPCVTTVRLDDLEQKSARGILETYGISEPAVIKKIDTLGGHPLSVHVLASFVKSFGTDALDSMDLSDAAMVDPQASKLSRILQSYALAISPDERDLLAALSSFPVFFPIWEGKSDDSLPAMPATNVDIEPHLSTKMKRAGALLEQRSLVQKFILLDAQCLSAHPFVREYFRPLLRLSPERVRTYLKEKEGTGLFHFNPSKSLGNDFFFSQISLPEEEWIAPYTAWCFNIVNLDLNVKAIRALDVRPKETVVDIGFGGGVSLRYLLERTLVRRVYGVEASTQMLRVAESTFKNAITSSRLKLHNCILGTQKIPLEDEAIDKIMCVNTLYFVADPEKGLVDVLRLLRKMGKIVLGFETKSSLDMLGFSSAGFKTYDEAEAQALLASVGFGSVEVEVPRSASSNIFLVSGVKTRNRKSFYLSNICKNIAKRLF